MITKIERSRRERLVRTGEWNGVWIVLEDGREFYAHRSAMTPGGRVEFRDRDGLCHAIVDPASVTKAVH